MKSGVREFVCAGCGKKVKKSCAKSVKYCSPECYHKHREYKPQKFGQYKTCVNCGSQFYVPLCRASTAIACSTKCANEYQSRNKVHLICDTCKKEFVRSPSFSGQKYCSIECRNKNEGFLERLVEMNAAQSKKYLNGFEKTAYKLMSDMQIDYIPQYVVCGKFVVDAFIPHANTVVQFDGDYWHGNPLTYQNPDSRQKKRMALDISQDAYMKKCGIRVVRIWQSDFKDIKSVISVLSNI